MFFKRAPKSTKDLIKEVTQKALAHNKIIRLNSALEQALSFEELMQQELQRLVKTQASSKSMHRMLENYEHLAKLGWCPGVYCPKCGSDRIKKTTPELPDNFTKSHKYLCINCHHAFNDDGDTPFEQGLPPITVWSQCLELLLRGMRVEHIASQMHLDLKAVRYMIKQLQAVLGQQKSLEQVEELITKKEIHSFGFKRSQQEKYQEKQLLHGADTPKAPADSAEYRHQKERRMNPGAKRK